MWEGLQREIKEEIGEQKIKKTIPMETFISNDENFLYHTYLCVVEKEFIPALNTEHDGYAWVSFGNWPKPLHQGLRKTFQNKTNISHKDDHLGRAWGDLRRSWAPPGPILARLARLWAVGRGSVGGLDMIWRTLEVILERHRGSLGAF